jgi:hypothetical protein
VLCEQLAKVLELKLPAAAIVPPLLGACRHIYKGLKQVSHMPHSRIFFLHVDGMTNN